MSVKLPIKISLLLILAAIALCLPARPVGAGQQMRVTQASLRPDNPRPDGNCPATITFGGSITTDGPGTVTYTFTRSDGATGPAMTLYFQGAGTQRVGTTWTLGDASTLPSYDGWQAVKILSPNEIESSHESGGFALRCGGGAMLQQGEKQGGFGGKPQAPLPQPSPSRPAGGGPDETLTRIDSNSAGQVPPVISRPGGGTGGQPDIDENGNPRTNSGPSGSPRPLAGSFRVTLNGYKVNHQTRDDILERDGVGDEATLVLDLATVDSAGGFVPLRWGNIFSSLMGQQPRNEIRAGTGSDRGGLITGDGFPTATPWRRLTPLNPGIPPNILFEGELTQGANAALIIATIWESDGTNTLRAAFADSIERARPAITSSVARIIGGPLPPGASSFLMPGASLGIGNTVTLGHGPLGLGQVDDRPVGMRVLGSNFGFTPQALVLTYDGARALTRADFGFGRGVIPVRYQDDPSLEGDYTLFIQVEETGGEAAGSGAPCPATLSAGFTGTATMTTTHGSAPGPFTQSLRLGLEFADCRNTVRITDFPPIAVSFDTPVGRNTTTVSMPEGGSGVYDPATGRMEVPVTLRFANSIAAGGTSFADMTLTTTAPGGSPASGGSVTLVGSGRFRGGFLNGETCRLTVTGTISPAP